ncbi:c-type cytochrome [Rhizobium oryzicola]|uniref:Cytochrome c n=1 Tax=Rhizobium oryzicola TaxID=1232668 RepID=A0ABT8SYD7_9HYPH|nr:cytochrome c [Rhizobium oryzicola]MDO1583366.1 cytochrome c [Rhizobium oryzicola]
MFRYSSTARSVVIGLFAACSLVGTVCAQDASRPQAELIARGRYLAMAADCAACHTAPEGGQPYAGGYGIQSPLGTIFSTNITPSKVNGIGEYTEADFARAVRAGVAKDGTHLYPAMPFTAYAKLSDTDISALYAFFKNEVKPVDQASRKTELPFPFSIRASMAVWNMLFLSNERFQPDAARSADWNRGAYLAEALEHCSTCHTPRNLFMAEDTRSALSGGTVGPWSAPNITSDKTSGIGGWSDAELLQYLRTGHVAGKAQAAGPMAEDVEHSLQHLTDADLRALVTYLRGTKPVASSDKQPRYSFGKPSASEASLRGLPGQAPAENGFHVFSGACANCHQADGSGNAHYPSLFNNTATGADNPDNLISTILFGLNRTVDGVPVFMPAFGPDASFTDRLSDKDVADVSNYVLSQFGNAAVKVGPEDVARVREGGRKPFLALAAPYIAPIAVVVAVILLVFIGLVVARGRRRVAPA